MFSYIVFLDIVMLLFMSCHIVYYSNTSCSSVVVVVVVVTKTL